MIPVNCLVHPYGGRVRASAIGDLECSSMDEVSLQTSTEVVPDLLPSSDEQHDMVPMFP
jgi:hypothetical protein